ncbi:hypothetical protein [Legionella fairfieldensis]|nr:hypothetical protein [Legionella fairfieldensis]
MPSLPETIINYQENRNKLDETNKENQLRNQETGKEEKKGFKTL